MDVAVDIAGIVILSLILLALGVGIVLALCASGSLGAEAEHDARKLKIVDRIIP